MVLSAITNTIPIHIHHDTCIHSLHTLYSHYWSCLPSPREGLALPTTVFANSLVCIVPKQGLLLFIIIIIQDIILWKCMCDSCHYYHSCKIMIYVKCISTQTIDIIYMPTSDSPSPLQHLLPALRKNSSRAIFSDHYILVRANVSPLPQGFAHLNLR